MDREMGSRVFSGEGPLHSEIIVDNELSEDSDDPIVLIPTKGEEEEEEAEEEENELTATAAEEDAVPPAEEETGEAVPETLEPDKSKDWTSKDTLVESTLPGRDTDFKDEIIEIVISVYLHFSPCS